MLEDVGVAWLGVSRAIESCGEARAWAKATNKLGKGLESPRGEVKAWGSWFSLDLAWRVQIKGREAAAASRRCEGGQAWKLRGGCEVLAAGGWGRFLGG